jgi:O-succinylhomoserine sulfhydrylase
MSEDPQGWEVATRLVRGGTTRSQYGETAEALYLTQSFIYESAEGANARFAGDEPGFIYSPCSRAPRPAAPPPRAWRPCTWP